MIGNIVFYITNQNVENNNEDKNEKLDDTLNDARVASEQLIFDLNESDDELQTNDNILNKTNRCIQIPRSPDTEFWMQFKVHLASASASIDADADARCSFKSI